MYTEWNNPVGNKLGFSGVLLASGECTDKDYFTIILNSLSLLGAMADYCTNSILCT